MDRDVIYYKEVDSANTRIKELAKTAKEGLVVVADRQTAGRGRRGRTWESTEEGNLYMSVLLKPELEVTKAAMLTLVMAYSVAKALQRWEIDVQIKWPNDLIMGKKKICGILTEMEVLDGQIDFIVVGVGLNLGQQVFSEELKEKATSIFAETGRRIDREQVLSAIMDVFEENYACFLENKSLEFLMQDYNDLLVNRDKQVVVLDPAGEYEGYAQGINADGELQVIGADGTITSVFAGEVSVRGIYGYV